MAASYLPCLTAENDRDNLIIKYFGQGYSNLEILSFLAVQHDAFISLSTLKRNLIRLDLRRRSHVVEDHDVMKEAISNELVASGRCLGYRKIWSVIRKMGIPARRDTVTEIMMELDPEGVKTRKKRKLRRRLYDVPGPDFIWHIDGYDKLKPFGFSIHGCIDGFSRRIIWLEVATTSKQPEVIAHFYIQAVKQLKRVPTRIRSDDGTENSIAEAIQIALRASHSDEHAGIASYIIGTSTANQRIESLWSQFRKDRIVWWRNFFQEMLNMGVLDTNNAASLECLRYCFMKLIREDLTDFMQRWNRHIIAPSTNYSLPRGRPALYILFLNFTVLNHK